MAAMNVFPVYELFFNNKLQDVIYLRTPFEGVRARQINFKVSTPECPKRYKGAITLRILEETAS